MNKQLYWVMQSVAYYVLLFGWQNSTPNDVLIIKEFINMKYYFIDWLGSNMSLTKYLNCRVHNTKCIYFALLCNWCTHWWSTSYDGITLYAWCFCMTTILHTRLVNVHKHCVCYVYWAEVILVCDYKIPTKPININIVIFVYFEHWKIAQLMHVRVIRSLQYILLAIIMCMCTYIVKFVKILLGSSLWQLVMDCYHHSCVVFTIRTILHCQL